MISGSSFRCPVTGLSLVKPGSWEYLPGPWLRPDLDTVVPAPPDGATVIENGRAPILAIRRRHGSKRHPRPTVQLFRRPFEGPIDLTLLTCSVREKLPRFLPDCRFLELTLDALVAGQRAATYLMEYTLEVAAGDGGPPLRYRCRTRGYTIPRGSYAITITLLSSTVRRYGFWEDLREIERSISFSSGSAGWPA
jgi:hypothetical protein